MRIRNFHAKSYENLREIGKNGSSVLSTELVSTPSMKIEGFSFKCIDSMLDQLSLNIIKCGDIIDEVVRKSSNHIRGVNKNSSDITIGVNKKLNLSILMVKVFNKT
jgi:hypothetical protein